MGRLRGFVWLFAGLVVAGLAGIVAFATLTQATPEIAASEDARPKVTVVVAARLIPIRTVLTHEDVQIKEIAVDAVPEGAISTLEEAEGMISMVDLYPGEMLLAKRLLDPNVTTGDGRLALYVAEDELLMAIPADDLLTSLNVLKPGDRVDLAVSLDFPVNRELQALASQPGGASSQGSTTTGTAVGSGTQQDEDEPATFVVLQSVGIAGIIGGAQQSDGNAPLSGGSNPGGVSQPQALLITIDPQDALILKFALDANGIQSILLRAPGVDRPYDTDPVDVDYVINRYQIPTAIGE